MRFGTKRLPRRTPTTRRKRTKRLKAKKRLEELHDIQRAVAPRTFEGKGRLLPTHPCSNYLKTSGPPSSPMYSSAAGGPDDPRLQGKLSLQPSNSPWCKWSPLRRSPMVVVGDVTGRAAAMIGCYAKIVKNQRQVAPMSDISLAITVTRRSCSPRGVPLPIRWRISSPRLKPPA